MKSITMKILLIDRTRNTLPYVNMMDTHDGFELEISNRP